MEDTHEANAIARDTLTDWETEIKKNVYSQDSDFIHTIQFQFGDRFTRLHAELDAYGQIVPKELEALVSENNLAQNLPYLEPYSQAGQRIDKVVHHPAYIQAGDLIYGTQLLSKMSEPGGLSECLAFLFLSAQTGEAGHHCPIACSAGMIRVLQKMPDLADKTYYVEKLTAASFQTNFTGAQFLTEIQGGSDVGLNATRALENADGTFKIEGEKWFCSNANADLIFITARYDEAITGTQGLGLFLVPARWKGHKNHYTIRRLKNKIGTRSMATGEIDFRGAHAIAMGAPKDGIHLVMDNVLHLSRLFNSFCVLGMARRAYTMAHAYAKRRIAFGQPVVNYPLIKENLAHIKAENSAMLAAIFATARLQDEWDLNGEQDDNTKLLLRLLVNIQKYLSAFWSVQHIHHALDVFAGNGTIETFSPIPRLLRDCIVCENWEGTHNVLRAQVQRDILKYHIDQIYLDFMRGEISKLHSFNEFTLPISSGLDELAQALHAFRELDGDLQSLQIRTIVDKMSVLYCSLMLLKEALDQQQMRLSSSKLNCFRLFNILHINEKELSYNKDYLKLISQIIS